MKREIKIGSVTINGMTALGPMAGVTDPPFRVLCKEQGVDLLYTEMVSAKGIHYRNKNTKALLYTAPEENPVALQLFGEDPEIMAETAKRIEELPFDILDINMGCPVPKVVNNGEGSALMQDPLKIGRIVEAVSKATVKPVTVKMRRGFDVDECTAPECAYVAQESGAAAVAVHGRTREQFYSGKADWGVIRAVKERVHIPVIGNGDVNSAESAVRMMLDTGCDMIMVGRAAQGNPWIFAEIQQAFASLPDDYFEKNNYKVKDHAEIILPEYAGPSWPERRKTILRHAKELCEFKGEQTAIAEMRKHVCWYAVGFPGSARLRASLCEIITYADLERLLPE